MQPDRRLQTQEIEITPEMIEAGVLALVGFDWLECDDVEAARAVYLAMSGARRVQTSTAHNPA